MNRRTRRVIVIASASAALLLPIPVVAQVPGTSASGQAVPLPGEATSQLTRAEIEAALAAVDSDAGIDTAAKDLLRPQYKRAIDAVEKAAEFAATTAEYRDAINTAPDTAAALRAELTALPPVERASKVSMNGTLVDLQKTSNSQRTLLTSLTNDLTHTTDELARVKDRPTELNARRVEAQRTLADIRSQLESPRHADAAPSPGREAERILLQAEQARLMSELGMLQQEQLSQSIREDLLQARRDLLTRQVENATAASTALQAILRARLSHDARRVGSLADAMPKDLREDDEQAQGLAAEVKALAEELEDVVVDLKQVTAMENDIMPRLMRSVNEYELIRKHRQLGDGGGTIAQVLFALQRRVRQDREDVLLAKMPTLGQMRLAALRVDEKLYGQPELERKFAARPAETITQLVATRSEALEKLRAQYARLIQGLATLEMDREEYLRRADEACDFIRRGLLWMRTCPPISVTTVTEIPAGLRWAFGRDHWLELGRALWATVSRMPVRSTLTVCAVALLLLSRRRMGAAIERTGIASRRITLDRYALTGEALLWTVLLAAPIPLLIGFMGWALDQTIAPSQWLQDTADGWQLAAWVTLVGGFLVAVCRPGGLGVAHFRWREERLPRFRGAICLSMVVYVPAIVLTISYHLHGQASIYSGSVGRTSFLLAHAWIALVVWRLIYGPEGLLPTLLRDHPTLLVTRWRYLWAPLVLACPIALIVLALYGYLLAAVNLSIVLFTTVTLIAGGVILNALAVRWFMVKWRKLALAEAMERRRLRHEAVAAEGREENSGEVVSVDSEEEEQLDLNALGLQTRHFLRLLFGLGVAIAILLLWSEMIPLFTTLREIAIPLAGGRNLLQLSQSLLIVVVTYIAMKDLPGLLELAVLRATTIEAGTRHAIATLGRYAVVAIGVSLLLSVLQVDWEKFGWIAAALSVGIGFGLQEVVANVVCGLILLFECPIRVGDVVTVEGMTGTVTKIRLRATTITNWDRQEFVVPNKTLITGTLTNWTLSAPINRVVLPVGVAYGSDTEKARAILIDIAAQHPLVLDDPAPLATFEQFADSSLNLALRAYLPNLDDRLRTITELHTEIDRRFALAGIEIAFPQHDLHLRSGWDRNDRTAAATAKDTTSG